MYRAKRRLEELVVSLQVYGPKCGAHINYVLCRVGMEAAGKCMVAAAREGVDRCKA